MVYCVKYCACGTCKTFHRAKADDFISVRLFLAKKYKINKTIKIPAFPVIIGGVIGFVFMAISQASKVKELPYLLSNIIALFTCFPLAVCVILTQKLIPIIGKNIILYWIGICSYEIYLVHSFTLQILSPNLLAVCLFVFITLVLTVCLYLLNKRATEKLLSV